MSFVNVAVGVSQAYTQAKRGEYANALARAQADHLDYLAKVEEDKGLQLAQMLRRAGREQVGAANAAYAGAGVKVGEGSALEVERQINLDVEHDAHQTLLEAWRRGSDLRLEGQLTRIQGKAEQTAGYINAFSTVLGTAYQGYTKWKTTQPKNGPGYDPRGFNGTNDRPAGVSGNSMDWWLRNGRSGD